MATQTFEKAVAAISGSEMTVEVCVSGASQGIQMVEYIVAELAPTAIPILIVGESGTGKELFANRIHRLSQSWSAPLTKIRCASMTAESLQTELALPSGADDARPPEESGTVLFDEIADLDPSCQRSLLCALPDGDATRAGVLKSRTISTTSRNLDEEIRAGRFRSELYYRIAGVCLRLPALRERKEDIPVLVDFFMNKYAAQFGRRPLVLSAAAKEKLIEYSWPGNIRELENLVKKVVALGDEYHAVAELCERSAEKNRPHMPTGSSSLKAAARAASRVAEKELILKALERTRWNRKRAAQDLQISYKSLLYKLKQIGVEEREAN